MRYLLICLLFASSIHCPGQVIDYTGHYGYSESRKDLTARFPGIKKEESGYSNELLLLRLKNNQYKFWLYIMKGYRNYNSGEIEGIVDVVKDSATFFLNDTLLPYTCRLIFHFYKSKISIDHMNGNCGFGANVTANGIFPKKNSTRPTFRNVLNMYQFNIPQYRIVSARALVYKKADTAMASKKYFTRNDKIYAFDEENDFIYVELITKNGKYIEGWIKKSDINY